MEVPASADSLSIRLEGRIKNATTIRSGTVRVGGRVRRIDRRRTCGRDRPGRADRGRSRRHLPRPAPGPASSLTKPTNRDDAASVASATGLRKQHRRARWSGSANRFRGGLLIAGPSTGIAAARSAAHAATQSARPHPSRPRGCSRTRPAAGCSLPVLSNSEVARGATI